MPFHLKRLVPVQTAKVKQDLRGAEACYRAAIEADPEDKDAARRLAKVPENALCFSQCFRGSVVGLSRPCYCTQMVL